MDDLRISCIIPTLNRGRILCETVRMLGQQTYRPHDIIIVDQTAKQDSETERILDALIADKTIVRLRQSEPNASLARNSGARAATGDILLFLDDDISIEPDLLASYARAFSDTSVQAVAGQILEGDAQTVEILSKSQTNTETGWLYFPKNYSGRCETGWMASGNFAIRRERFFEIGGLESLVDVFYSSRMRQSIIWVSRVHRKADRVIGSATNELPAGIIVWATGISR